MKRRRERSNARNSGSFASVSHSLAVKWWCCIGGAFAARPRGYSSSGQPAISPIAALLATRRPSIAHFIRVGLMPMPTFSRTTSFESFATSSSRHALDRSR